MKTTLADLEQGDRAKILSLGYGNAACRQKLFACGLVPGVELLVIRVAPLGDPLQIRVADDIMLSIRKAEGHEVYVQKI